MVTGDVIIFINDDNDAVSFTRGHNGFWHARSLDFGIPNDQDIQGVKNSGRRWIHIRGQFIVALNLGGDFKPTVFEKV